MVSFISCLGHWYFAAATEKSLRQRWYQQWLSCNHAGFWGNAETRKEVRLEVASSGAEGSVEGRPAPEVSGAILAAGLETGWRQLAKERIYF